jgi:hypothetical protein
METNSIATNGRSHQPFSLLISLQTWRISAMHTHTGNVDLEIPDVLPLKEDTSLTRGRAGPCGKVQA